MGKIVVFGGSFNPPTRAHYELGLKALEFLDGDRLCFVPVGDKYSKDGLIESKHRVNMLNLLCDNHNNECVDVDLTEVNAQGNLNTINTLRILGEKYNNATLYFLLGADNLLHLTEWHKAEEILRDYKILAIKRDGYSIKDIIKHKGLLTKYKDNIIEVDIKEEMMISSTMVRKMIVSKDESVIRYINENVNKYIQENNLYKYIK